MADVNVAETNTENLFRTNYGAKTFVEKAAIPKKHGFLTKENIGKNPTDKDWSKKGGYPDFFKECGEYDIIVEAKGTDHVSAEEQVRYYMEYNNINIPMVGMAVSGQTKSKLKVTYYYSDGANKSDIKVMPIKDTFAGITDIKKSLTHCLYGDFLSDDELTKILKAINEKFHDIKVRDTDRSLFFSGLMIALTNKNFRSTYNSISEPDRKARATTRNVLLDAHGMNKAILDAIDEELEGKINNLSKEFSWKDRFSFIKTIDCPLNDYKKLIQKIETNIFVPFKNSEKQDVLGRAYKIFLSRSGKIDNKNIILTPDHIKRLMVDLADVSEKDVVLDTCTGSGGFLMDSMETMLDKANGDISVEISIKEKQLIGFEIDSVLFCLACSNMFLHGDGRTNMLYRSSLLDMNKVESENEQLEEGDIEEDDLSDDTILYNYIKSLHPTKVIINPPYESSNHINFTKQALDYLGDDGVLVIIMPTPTLTKNLKETAEILKTARLDCVIKMPKLLFSEQSRRVNSSIFIFTKTGKPHKQNEKVLFCNLKDDGFVSVQHKGRIDKYNMWSNIRKTVLYTVTNKDEVAGFSEKRLIYDADGTLYPAGVRNSSLSSSYVTFGDLFNKEDGTLASESNNPNGQYDFITGTDDWKKHDSYVKECEAIVYIINSDGSSGKAHYVNGKFTASNLSIVMTEKDHDKYPLDMKVYAYYLNSLREQIVSDLEDGTSKLTINQNLLFAYPIKYIPWDEQVKLRAKIDAYEVDKKALLAKSNALSSDLCTI